MKDAKTMKGKKVLVMGLGVLGGGRATTEWFLRKGARVTVTDLRTEAQLEKSLKELGLLKKKIHFVLGTHRIADFQKNDIIVANPAVPRESKYLAAAKKAKKEIVNDAKIFFDIVENPIIAITGTRGKTTTTNWIAYLMQGKYPHAHAAGNSSSISLLARADTLKKGEPAIVELSSWQLEHVSESHRAPDVAIITNIYPDHLNRYSGIKDYASAKANIFAHQNKSQTLILNADNSWTSFFLKQNPKSHILFFSEKRLSKEKFGVFLSRGEIYIKDEKGIRRIVSNETLEKNGNLGSHNIQNLMASLLACYAFGISLSSLTSRIRSLPQIQYREEIILKTKKYVAINDSTATSPDAVIAAIRRFRSPNLFLITGGTDKNLEFKELAKAIKSHMRPQHIYLLNGSGTRKLYKELFRLGFFKKQEPQLYEDLSEILIEIKKKSEGKKPGIILFSPGCASFEKFKNEFDRGEKFNVYCKKIFNS